MASYVIAGPAGDESFSECEYLGQQLELSSKAAVTVVTKHPDEWDEYLRKVCNSFGFYKPVTPIVFTSDGKYIGGLEHFKEHVCAMQLRRLYRIHSDLKKPERMVRAELDLERSEARRRQQAKGPSLLERIRARLSEIRAGGQIQIIDGFFQRVVQDGLEFQVKRSQLLTPTNEDLSALFGKELPFVHIPELPVFGESEETEVPAESTKEDVAEQSSSQAKESKDQSQESVSEEESEGMGSPDLSLETEKRQALAESDEENEAEVNPPAAEAPESPGVNDSLLTYQVTDFNLKDFMQRFQGKLKKKEARKADKPVPIPKVMKTVCIPDEFVVEALSDDFVLAAHPFPLVPGQLFIFPGEHTDQDGRWLVRDVSLTPSWLKLISIPPQRPVYEADSEAETQSMQELIEVKSHSGSLLASRGYTLAALDLGWMASRNPTLRLNPLQVTISHLLTEQDWKVWFPLVREVDGIGFYQWLPYGAKKYGVCSYHPLSVGCLSLLVPPPEGVDGPVPLLRLVEIAEKSTEDIFTLEELDFDHAFYRLSPETSFEQLPRCYTKCIQRLNVLFKDYSECWLFVAPVYKPIAREQGYDVFLDPLAYLGLMHLPVLQKQWPETAGIQLTKGLPMELLSRASKHDDPDLIPI